MTGVVSAGDLEKIVNLLLSLCNRLSRIDRSLLALEGEELTREGAAEERVRLKDGFRRWKFRFNKYQRAAIGNLQPGGHMQPSPLSLGNYIIIKKGVK